MAFARGASRACVRATVGTIDRAVDGLLWLHAWRVFQRSGLFAALPLTGRVLEVEGDRGHLAEAAVHHIPNRRCVVVDSGRLRRHRVDHRVRRRKFHRVCAPPDCLPFADGSFDAAWTTFALARLVPGVQDAMLSEMTRVVRPGGVLVAVEYMPGPGSWRMQARLREALTFCRPFGPRHHRSVEEWRIMLPRHGWRIEAEHAPDRSNYRTFVCRRS